MSWLTRINLEEGIKRFEQQFLEKEKEKDFHHGLYCRLREWQLKADWQLFVDELCRWKAQRPTSKAKIFCNGQKRLSTIAEKVAVLRNRRISDSTLAWDDHLKPVFTEIQEIKPTASGSPVFPSKLGHFLLPHLFIVTDGVYTRGAGFNDYGGYWMKITREWNGLENGIRGKFTEILTNKIRHNGYTANLDSYPFATKIIELCTAGAKAIRHEQAP